MFTGIVQFVGIVAGLRPSASQGLTEIEIDPGKWQFLPSPGDSISVDGCCLTLTQSPGSDRLWHFQAVPETLSKTTLGMWSLGKRVNLEHAATASTFLGGHLVQGHVDGVGEVLEVRRGTVEGDWRVRVRPPKGLMEFMVPKGSVCLSGVSLTLAAVSVPEGWIEVALIPATLEKTNLKSLEAGECVNVEADAMAKTMIHWLRHYSGR